MSTDNPSLGGLQDPRDCAGMLQAIARGATRRDVVAMLMAGGMQAGTAGSMAALAAMGAIARRRVRRRTSRSA